MKENYKIYLIFWGPCFLLIVLTCFSFFLIKQKVFSTPFYVINLSSSYIEIINEINALNYLKPFQLIEKTAVNKDLFVNAKKTEPSKEKTLLTTIKPYMLNLSMIYIEGNKKKCIINDKYFTEGSNLTQDIKIVKIGDYYVDLQIKGEIKRLFLGQTISF
ncbi:hypothetical protein F1847_07640 [Thermodesulfobacterium sp. TA1]|uniref:hypothetical protein n=1 Tax=Thermodesulfobacterium sp. TA1 TaxID=2234087 RepID=UPI0012322CB3|nr:hypothetical protein [Thermodesulfobacterium sp. TA1]QER42617.1 hypothetical protein F1847_07640 [Thermodesulfobacterium sp. TA1]